MLFIVDSNILLPERFTGLLGEKEPLVAAVIAHHHAALPDQ